MRTIQRYIASSYLLALFLSVLVLTFVMSLALLMRQLADWMGQGVGGEMLLRVMLISVPTLLMFTLPLGALVSALLVFGRMSADSEISAMQACGISLFQIRRTPILIACFLTVVSLGINDRIVAEGHYMRRSLGREMKAEDVVKLLRQGRWITEFPGMTIWVGDREGNTLRDLLIFERLPGGGSREIRAREAEVLTEGGDVVLDMRQVRVDPFSEDRPGVATAHRYRHVIRDAVHVRSYRRNEDDYYFWELISGIWTGGGRRADLPEEAREEWVTRLKVELNKRLALSAACLCFVVLGVPLGITTNRRESSVGIAVSLAVAIVFYIFIILSQGLIEYPALHPHLLIWIPVVGCLWLGQRLTRRAE